MTGPRFIDRTRQLMDEVGGGHLTARVIVDQPYAMWQHENLRYRHKDGGQAKFLEKALNDNQSQSMRHLAESVLSGGLRGAMIDVSEWIAEGVYHDAPFEFGDLRGSAAPSVKDGRGFIYNRPPNIRRLNKSELRAKAHLRDLGFGNFPK